MSEPDETFALEQNERNSAVWKRLADHFEVRLKRLRANNDGPLSETETLTLRGQIKLLKSLIALGNEPPNFDG